MGDVHEFYHLNRVWNNDLMIIPHAKQFSKMVYRDRAVPEAMTMRERRRAGRNEEEIIQFNKRRKVEDYAYMGSYDVDPPAVAMDVEYEGFHALIDAMEMEEREEEQRRMTMAADTMDVDGAEDVMEIENRATAEDQGGFNVRDPRTPPISTRTRAQVTQAARNLESDFTAAGQYSDESDEFGASDESPTGKFRR